jgi:hypothetical protein
VGCSEADTSPPTKAQAASESIGRQQQPLQVVIETPNNSGPVSTFAGTGQPGTTDHTDPLQAKLNEPTGIAVAGAGPNAGAVYIADWGNNSIRRIKADGTLDTFLAGKPNLITNPRAEQPMSGTLPGWTSQSGSWVARSGSTPFDGSQWFWGGNFADSVATQTISLTQYATTIS